jgi:hypothetical protein
MARYSRTFAAVGRVKQRAYRQRQRQALTWLALHLHFHARR